MKDNVCAPGLVILLSAIFLVSTATAQAGWWRTHGGAAIDPDHFVQQTADGGYILVGYTASFGEKFDDAYLIKTDSLGNVGVAEESPGQQTSGRKPAATVGCSLPKGAAAFDATGRRVHRAKPGVCFVRIAATAAPRKVLLVE